MFNGLLEELRGLPTDQRTLRRFGLAVGGVFLGIAGLLLWKADWTPGMGTGVLLALGFPLAVFGLFLPGALRPIYRPWMGLALVLGAIMTRVLLTGVFFLVVTPTALMMRLFGADPMKRKPDPTLGTYWIKRPAEEDLRERMERYF